jgi:cysteine-S-conjugate beta-lyase
LSQARASAPAAAVDASAESDVDADAALSTRLIHHPYQPPAGFAATAPGVHKASTVFFPSMAAARATRWDDKSGYTYGLHGTPTTFTLEARLASLEGARHVLLLPSGLAALIMVDQALLSAGDVVLVPDNVYDSRRPFLQRELARWGVQARVYDPMDIASLAAAIDHRVALVWLEGAGSVTLEFPDLRGLLRCARERLRPGARVAIDHTWGAGLAYCPFDLGEGLGADIAVHALTKYPSGGGDVMMGSIACIDDALYQQLAWAHCRSGTGVGGNDAELLLRSLASLPLRYAAQDAAARRVAAWCLAQSRPFVRVLHPPTPGSPGHAHWASHCKGAASLLTLEIDPACSETKVDAFVERLKLFRIGYSWGGPVSLVMPYHPKTLRSLPTPYQGMLVRLCIGLEDPQDLIADLEQALVALV